MTDILDYLNRRVTFDMESLRGIHFSEFSPIYLAKIDAKELFGAISEIENLRAENERLRKEVVASSEMLEHWNIRSE